MHHPHILNSPHILKRTIYYETSDIYGNLKLLEDIEFKTDEFLIKFRIEIKLGCEDFDYKIIKWDCK